MKKNIFIILILLLTGIPFIPVTATEDWTIIGDTVFTDDSRAYLSAKPHTISSSGWVEFTLISKQYTGDIDVVWGFNRTESRPRTPQIWTNYSHTLWRWIEVEYINETTGDPYTVHEKEYYESTFFDWKPLNKEYTKLQLKAKGMDTWYILKEVSVIAGKEYKLRIWIDIPFAGTGVITGKYAWGIKLSSDTIREAIDNNRFYFMDPWYDSSWLYRTSITADSGDIGDTLTNFTVMVYLNSSRISWPHVQDDLDDLRFTSSDGVTLLDYEIEDHTVNTEAWLWVRLPSVSPVVDTVFYMYYGNTGASNGEDVEGTWDTEYVMVQHMVDKPNNTLITDSTQYDNDGAKTGANEPIETTSGKIDSAQIFDGVNDRINCGNDLSLNITEEITISFWGASSSPDVDNQIILGKNHLSSYYINTAVGRINWWTNGVPATTSAFGYNDGVFHHIVCTFDNGIRRVYVDGVLDKLQVGTLAHDVNDVYIGRSATVANYYNGTIDEVRIFNITSSLSWVFAEYESGRDDLLTYGVVTEREFGGSSTILTLVGLIAMTIVVLYVMGRRK